MKQILMKFYEKSFLVNFLFPKLLILGVNTVLSVEILVNLFWKIIVFVNHFYTPLHFTILKFNKTSLSKIAIWIVKIVLKILNHCNKFL